MLLMLSSKRDFPVWTVVAADEFSVEPITWCYPIIGCAGYRGYYSLQGANNYAKTIMGKGYETSVGGAGAYSTLGWFDDPLLPSMMRYGVADFAETIFHELAHQVVYIKNNTSFNEAFATTVGEQGALLWLHSNRPDLLAEYQARILAKDDFSRLLTANKATLAEVYASNTTLEEMRNAKQIVLGSLRKEYENLKEAKWKGVGWFDSWFDVPVNNARLAAFASYRDQVPEFANLLSVCAVDFNRFYASVKIAGQSEARAVVPNDCLVDVVP